MTEVVLFDFGGVVIRTPFELHGYDWRGPFDVASDPLWARSMTGEITEREYWHRQASRYFPDADDPTHEFMRSLYEQDESVVVRPEVVALLDALQAAGLRTAVLTNDLAAFHPPEWIERMSVVRRFDPVIDLSHVGFLKPQPEAFEHALKELGLAREEASSVVFLDDQPRNVAGAVAAGMRGVHFDPTDVPGSVSRLLAEAGLTDPGFPA
ncbi:HAD family phosphatase [Phycicoccus sp.]|uniref:HAD family hydrolase n=1 Tax=Phycicoccus sp. TaxID=1902410 RepID=UPI002CFBEAF8|nr:HAD family phosphatase [Phycicoccus sp.]HMM96007.1 HAD family phosphatase [Phycicoccus sp.]